MAHCAGAQSVTIDEPTVSIVHTREEIDAGRNVLDTRFEITQGSHAQRLPTPLPISICETPRFDLSQRWGFLEEELVD